ncbi:hypothetical protein TNCT_133321 [Trichonephila clavata]|uniref:Uncharacterized protein n=1 Tax=Trichonephila clavata TaxID=2740835 RepID=A0A8X6L9D1_TRICU|nr:hypothetical protein TNCT_133321 [Trichonephila clavata]
MREPREPVVNNKPKIFNRVDYFKSNIIDFKDRFPAKHSTTTGCTPECNRVLLDINQGATLKVRTITEIMYLPLYTAIISVYLRLDIASRELVTMTTETDLEEIIPRK